MSTTDPSWKSPQPHRPATSLAKVLEKSEHVKELVEEGAVDLSSVNKDLKQELAGRDLPPRIEDALEKNEAAESKVVEASAELSAVNRALEGEIWHRNIARHGTFHDVLTGLPNRALFNDRLEHGLVQAKRHDWVLAVMLLDLDKFKKINEAHGREAGDGVLRTVAQRLKLGSRGDDTVSRLGGDEFLYLLMELRGEKDVPLIVEKVINAVQAPMAISTPEGNVTLMIKPSVGIALYPKNGTTVDTLVIGADLAMHQAKQSNSRYSFAR